MSHLKLTYLRDCRSSTPMKMEVLSRIQRLFSSRTASRMISTMLWMLRDETGRGLICWM